VSEILFLSAQLTNILLLPGKFSRQIGCVELAFVVKPVGAAQAVIFAQKADEHAFFLRLSSDLSRAAGLNVDHFSAKIAINRVLNHFQLQLWQAYKISFSDDFTPFLFL
jgi:hypothetical protein